MKKSIYYLIANAVSIIAAAIFLGCFTSKVPLFGFDLQVTSLVDTFYSLVFALPVLALSIIVTTRECTLNEAKPSLLSKVLLVVTAVATVLTIGYTWFSAVLVCDKYAINTTLSFPLVYAISYVVGVACLYLAPVINKKNANLSAIVVITALVLIVASIFFECFEKENALVAGIICGSVVLLTFAVPSLLSLKKSK